MPPLQRPALRTEWLAIGLALVVLLSGNALASPGSAGSVNRPVDATAASVHLALPVPAVSPPYNATLTISSSSSNLSSQFFGTTVNNEVRMFRGETDAVNATPAKVLVWPGAMAGEDYNPLTETHYDTYYGTPTKALTTESQFVTMCEAIHCTAIMQVPAEIDDPTIAEAIVNYTEVNLSFVPAYWMIGNEPELWEHWKIPWKNWPSQYTTGPDPTQFGDEVLQYVAAIRQVDNTTPILGLPASGCTCGYYTFDQWISGVLQVTGPKIQAVAFHEYPAGWLGTGNGSLQAFYGTLQTAAGIPTRMVAARAAVQTACPGCNVSVFISELGAALSWSTYGPYAIGFSGDLSIASQITQAMADNLSNIDLFATELATTNSWFNSAGNARPDYALYTSIFDHLGTEAFPVSIPGLGNTLYGIETLAPKDGGRQDLLVVNDNIGEAITFTPQFAGSYHGAAAEEFAWNGSIHITKSNTTDWVEPYTPEPVPYQLPNGLPARYTLPPQAMVLFESYPSAGTYVQVSEHGVPAPTAWYARVGNQLYATTQSNISLLLAPGDYTVSSVPIPLPIGGRELNPSERLAPFSPSPAVVRGPFSNISIDYVTQWGVNVTSTPDGAGNATPDVLWWNDSAPLRLTATPATGYAFAGWSGWGPGSYNGTNRSITIYPTGRITEKARFVLGEEVVLWQYGLPEGTDWSVTVRNFTTSSNSSFLTLYWPYGSYGFSVSEVPGYRALPRNGGFVVDSTVQLVNIRYVPITPPQPLFPVSFSVTGLPSTDSVAITVRGITQTFGGSGLPTPVAFSLYNGSYAYEVGYVAGYHANAPLKTFNVLGGPLSIVVPFVPTVYTATWAATGTRAGLNWSVIVDGVPTTAASAWVSATLPNGSYSYSIVLPANYTATPRTGTINISGSSELLPLVFGLMQFSAWFGASGSVPTASWWVRLGNLSQYVTGRGSSFLAANGTYTFDVHPPDGFYAVPSHGNLTVAGPGASIVIDFHPVSNQPSAALIAALTSGALSTSIWIGASIAVGFLTFRAFRRQGGRIA